jgi:AcrR family transcriptional regulator
MVNGEEPMQKSKVIKVPVFSNPERGDNARKKLIEAGLKIFSEVGYEAASTRSLAAAAGTNIASIPYYFRNKEGLYFAVIDHIIDYYQKGLGDGLMKIERALQNEKITPVECRALLDEYMRTLIHFVLQENRERSQVSHIYIREQLDPTSAFDRLYEGFVRDMQGTLAALVGRVLGDVPASEAKMITQTLLGQISVFKLSRETILHNMSWKNYGEKGMAEIERVVMRNLDAILQACQKKNSAS